MLHFIFVKIKKAINPDMNGIYIYINLKIIKPHVHFGFQIITSFLI